MGTKPIRRLGVVAMTAAAVAALAPTAAADPTWTAVVLPVPPDVYSVQVNGTDGVDRIVGSYDGFDENGQTRPGIVWQGTGYTVLGEAFDDLTELHAINTSGVAVGSHAAIGEQSQAVEWTGDHYVDLPTPAGSDSVASDVNENGDVVGTADYHVILWPASAPGTYQLLPMPYPTYASGVSISEDGTVAASVLEPVGSGPNHAYRWDGTGQPVELDRVQPNYEHSVLMIAGNQIAGSASFDGAALWNLDGEVVRYLPDTALYSVNGHGDLLARASTGGPWYVEENGVHTDLPAGFEPSTSPTSLLTDGSVAGYTYDEDTFEQTAVLWERT